jgi:hypothetical protein
VKRDTEGGTLGVQLVAKHRDVVVASLKPGSAVSEANLSSTPNYSEVPRLRHRTFECAVDGGKHGGAAAQSRGLIGICEPQTRPVLVCTD